MSVNSIRNLVEIANDLTPAKIAVKDKNVSFTYEDVYTKVNQIAQYLTTLELEDGARIGIYSNKTAQKVIAILSVMSTKYIFVPITKLLKAEQLQYIIDDCDIKCILTDEKKLSTVQEISFAGTIVTVESCHKDIVSFEEIYKCYKGDYSCSLNGHDNAAITYSFASSGFPKGVVISHRNFIDGARSVSKYLDLKEEDTFSGLLSFSFDYGLNQIFCSFYKRATFVVHNFFTPSEFFTHLIKDEVSVLALMPIHITQMFDEDIHRLPSPQQLDNVRIITSSGGNVTDKMIQNSEKYFMKADFYSMIGHTEAFRSAYLEPSQLNIRPNSIGKAIPDVELYVINKEGYECKPREVGELIHRGAGIYKGFWNSKEDTDHSFKSIDILKNAIKNETGLANEIVVATGDFVYKDEEGYLYFVSRQDDMIKSSGYRISPVEIESVLRDNFSNISACAVFGIENEDIEEEIALVYTGIGEIPKNELIFELKKHLPTYMIPTIIIYRQSMPMKQDDKNKINKEILKDEIIKSNS
ncbi:MAG: AMP-binding protein [Arcobacteraceae bacterium]|nr:AMP-binding protein [Arcobacteraceae bacterium]